MVIKNTRLKKNKKSAILESDIALKSGQTQTLYFKVDRKFENFLSRDSTAIIPATLFSSMDLTEDLAVEGAASFKLTKNLSRIIELVEGWDIGLSQIKVNVGETRKDYVGEENVGCFFTCGVDSFYTLLKNDEEISHLIYVYGFDIPLGEKKLYKKVLKNINKVAKQLNKELIVVETNIRQFADNFVSWDYSHGGCLASVALAVGKGFKKVFIAGSNHITAPALPWGSHPGLDPLWSTEKIEIIHSSKDVDRFSETRFISKSGLALKTLRVCWLNPRGEYNCGKCEKCLRTMFYLYLSGKLAECKTFKRELDPKLVRNVRIADSEIFYWQQIEKLLNGDKNIDLVSAVHTAIQRYKNPNFKKRLLDSFRGYLHYLDEKYNRTRVYHYLLKKGLI